MIAGRDSDAIAGDGKDVGRKLALPLSWLGHGYLLSEDDAKFIRGVVYALLIYMAVMGVVIRLAMMGIIPMTTMQACIAIAAPFVAYGIIAKAYLMIAKVPVVRFSAHEKTQMTGRVPLFAFFIVPILAGICLLVWITYVLISWRFGRAEMIVALVELIIFLASLTLGLLVRRARRDH